MDNPNLAITHPYTLSITHPTTHSPTQLPTHPANHPSTQSSIYTIIHPPTQSSIHRITQSSIHLSIHPQIIVVLYLLYLQVGVSFVGGVIIAVILLPINHITAVSISKLTGAMMTHKDARVNVIGGGVLGAFWGRFGWFYG